MNFDRAYRNWEATWVSGPPEDRSGDYAEHLAVLSDELLDTEIGSLLGSLDELSGPAYYRALEGLEQARAERGSRFKEEDDADPE
jgi:hypothetical protein